MCLKASPKQCKLGGYVTHTLNFKSRLEVIICGLQLHNFIYDNSFTFSKFHKKIRTRPVTVIADYERVPRNLVKSTIHCRNYVAIMDCAF